MSVINVHKVTLEFVSRTVLSIREKKSLLKKFRVILTFTEIIRTSAF